MWSLLSYSNSLHAPFASENSQCPVPGRTWSLNLVLCDSTEGLTPTQRTHLPKIVELSWLFWCQKLRTASSMATNQHGATEASWLKSSLNFPEMWSDTELKEDTGWLNLWKKLYFVAKTTPARGCILCTQPEMWNEITKASRAYIQWELCN